MSGLDTARVLDLYKHNFRQTTPVVRELGGAGGFSGAAFWKISVGSEQYCLRKWPDSFQNEQRLEWIHKVVMYAAAAGCDFLPVPLRASQQQTWCRVDGCLWQLDPWVSGSATFWSDPNDAKLASAMETLAEFHKATSAFHQPSQPSPSVQTRLTVLQEMSGSIGSGPSGLARIEEMCSRRISADLFETAKAICERFRLLAPEIEGELQTALEIMITPQPCLADIWHDHLFFTGDRVTGLIDFGALRNDSPSLDIARLLGSLIGDDDRWGLGIRQYEQFRTLSETDKKLVSIFDRSTTLLSGMNWLHWIYVDRKAFDEMGSIADRLRKNAKRMNVLLSHR